MDDGDIAITIRELCIQVNYELHYELWQKMVHFMLSKGEETVGQTFERVTLPHES